MFFPPKKWRLVRPPLDNRHLAFHDCHYPQSNEIIGKCAKTHFAKAQQINKPNFLFFWFPCLVQHTTQNICLTFGFRWIKVMLSFYRTHLGIPGFRSVGLDVCNRPCWEPGWWGQISGCSSCKSLVTNISHLMAVRVIYNSEHLSVAGCLRNVLSQDPDKELAVRLRAANMT